MKTRKKKYVVWLENHTDRRDDEWIVVYSPTRLYAPFLAFGKFDQARFTAGPVYSATEFRKMMGFGA